MLPLSRKPEILRLHQLESSERSRYISEFTNVAQEYLPRKLWTLLPIIADIYFTYTTICLCKRRLGEEYTYVAMYNAKHYEEEGVLVNSKTRLLMFILEILQRHLIKNGFNQVIKKLDNVNNNKGLWRLIHEITSMGVEGIFEEGKLLMMMLFMLGWSKHVNLVDTILKNEYVYTYKNKSTAKVDYRIEGYLLLTVFLVKLLKFSYKVYQALNIKTQKETPSFSQSQPPQEQKEESNEELCRICYDGMKNKSVTSCGHIFCWECIIKYVGTSSMCPVCRNECQPKDIVQLQNY